MSYLSNAKPSYRVVVALQSESHGRNNEGGEEMKSVKLWLRSLLRFTSMTDEI